MQHQLEVYIELIVNFCASSAKKVVHVIVSNLLWTIFVRIHFLLYLFMLIGDVDQKPHLFTILVGRGPIYGFVIIIFPVIGAIISLTFST